MPPRAILDMKLGGSGSELDGLGSRRSFFVPNAHRPAAASIVVESFGCLGEARVELRDPRVNLSSMSIDLATANFQNILYPFRALKNSLLLYRSSHARIRDMKVVPQATIELRTAWLRVSIGRNNFA
jgi:hypothetical protein